MWDDGSPFRSWDEHDDGAHKLMALPGGGFATVTGQNTSLWMRILERIAGQPLPADPQVFVDTLNSEWREFRAAVPPMEAQLTKMRVVAAGRQWAGDWGYSDTGMIAGMLCTPDSAPRLALTYPFSNKDASTARLTALMPRLQHARTWQAIVRALVREVAEVTEIDVFVSPTVDAGIVGVGVVSGMAAELAELSDAELEERITDPPPAMFESHIGLREAAIRGHQRITTALSGAGCGPRAQGAAEGDKRAI